MREFIEQFSKHISAMRFIVNEARGGPLGDAAFKKYCEEEDSADAYSGRIAAQEGKFFGPKIDAEASRQERLEAREKFIRDYEQRTRGYQPAPGLEDSDARGGSSGGGGNRFDSLGENLRAIAAACTPGMAADPRLYSERATLGMGELVGQEGGFLLGKEHANDLLSRAWKTALIAPRCRQFSLPANRSSLDLPAVDEVSRATGSRLGGVQAYWLAEGATGTATKPKLRVVNLKPEKLACYLYVTSELLEDSSVLGDFIAGVFAEETSFQLDDAIFRGDGAGKPLGILNSAALVTVSKEASQPAATVQYENCVKMLARLKPGSARNAAWFINQQVLGQLPLMTLKIWNSPASEIVGGSAVFQPGNGAADAPFGRLLGLPIIVIEQASALGTVGDVVLADFSQYLLCRRNSARMDSTIAVEFMTDQQTFRFIVRVSGQPADDSALTPYKGSGATVSPFIALADRT